MYVYSKKVLYIILLLLVFFFKKKINKVGIQSILPYCRTGPDQRCFFYAAFTFPLALMDSTCSTRLS